MYIWVDPGEKDNQFYVQMEQFSPTCQAMASLIHHSLFLLLLMELCVLYILLWTTWSWNFIFCFSLLLSFLDVGRMWGISLINQTFSGNFWRLDGNYGRCRGRHRGGPPASVWGLALQLLLLCDFHCVRLILHTEPFHRCHHWRF